ncbi:MAG: helicase-related protein, partial [Bdellovibrionales bacterium]|nr:helicase-related protein [Bdellovibrionales bacterium]
MFIYNKFRSFVLLFGIGFISYQSFSADVSSEKLSVLSNQSHITNNRLIQDIALQAFEKALQEGSRGVLHISPNGTGKTRVLAQALKSRITKWELENRTSISTPSEPTNKAGKISIVTAHQIHLVDQLAQGIYQEVKDTPVHLINWNNVKQLSEHKSFASYVRKALEKPHPTVFVITSQSLRPALDHLFQEGISRNSQTSSASPASQPTPVALAYPASSLYEHLAKNLDGIYIDEAHHLGASKTKRSLLTLWEASRAFLYGATATPFHYTEDITELFKKTHWSYLNKADNLFEKHSIEEILDQLSLAIKNRDISPFNDLYVIGESSFKEIKDQPVFIQARSDYFVLNPAHYERLAQILYPVVLANQKGFIVTATIAEAERLQEFLGKKFREIQFEVYHSGMGKDERKRVLTNSEKSTGSHYIVAVRALDEGVNLPHLSAYIDLNFTISIRQMIQRIGRVLRLYPGKEVADVLFLVDYKNVEMVQDILNILEKVERVFFKEQDGGGGGNKRSGDYYLRFADSEITPLAREELLELREELQSSIRKFWSGKEFRWLTWEELRAAIREYNKGAPEGERINYVTYVKGKLYKKIPGAHSSPAQFYSDFKERGGWADLLSQPAKPPPPTLTWEELRAAIREYNKGAPEGERIINYVTYVKGYKKIPGAPSNPAQFYSDFKERGGWADLLSQPAKPPPPTLTWEEL